MKVLGKILLLLCMLFFADCFNIKSRFAYDDTYEEKNGQDFTNFHKRNNPVQHKGHFNFQKVKGDEETNKVDIGNEEQRKSRSFKHEKRNSYGKHMHRKREMASKEDEKGKGIPLTPSQEIKEDKDVTTETTPESTESNLVTTYITESPKSEIQQITKEVNTEISAEKTGTTTETTPPAKTGDLSPDARNGPHKTTENKPDNKKKHTNVKNGNGKGKDREDVPIDENMYENMKENEYIDYSGYLKPNGLETDVDDPNDFIIHKDSRYPEPANDGNNNTRNPPKNRL